MRADVKISNQGRKVRRRPSDLLKSSDVFLSNYRKEGGKALGMLLEIGILKRYAPTRVTYTPDYVSKHRGRCGSAQARATTC
jgi:hypothetical protein